MIVFNFAFIPPTFQLTLHGGENWLVFAVYVVTGLLVSDLAARARQPRARGGAARAGGSAARRAVDDASAWGDRHRRAGPYRTNPRPACLRVPWARIELGRGAELDGGAAGDRASRGRPGRRNASSLPGTGAARRSVRIALPSGTCRRSWASRSTGSGSEHEALEAEALRRSDALKTALLRSVSHDLRSPLTAIRACARRSREPGSRPRRRRRRSALVHTALVEAERLDRMVRNLLDLSRLEAGAARPRLRLDARPRASSSGALVSDPGGSSQAIDVTLPAELPFARASTRVQLERALVNLIDNAVKFSPPASRVRSARRAGVTPMCSSGWSTRGPASARRAGCGLRALPAGLGGPEPRGTGLGPRDRAWIRRSERRPALGRVGHRPAARPSWSRSRCGSDRCGWRCERRPRARGRRRAADPAGARDDPDRRRL